MEWSRGASERENMTRFGCLAVACGLLIAGGCNGTGTSLHRSYTTDSRLANGLVVILPGIEGESELNHNIRRGLLLAGIDRALPIYNWGRPIPGVGMLLNQMDFVGNRLAGVRIAKFIEEYQDKYPGQPVYVVGHSGGGGVAVFTAEGLSEGRQIDGLILLSASISAGYDLTKAIGKCRNGIVNFYNRGDTGLLLIGTTITSNVDGMRGPSAGLNGFSPLAGSDPPAKKSAYHKLYQVNVGRYGGGDPHAAATRPHFVSGYVAPWVLAQTWPAGAAKSSSAPGQFPSLAKAVD